MRGARRGDDRGALADFQQSLTLLESRRSSIASRDLRDVFVSTADDSFDELFELYWRRRDSDETFALGERRRGHVFLIATETAPLSAKEIARRLAPSVGVLVFTSSRKRTLATFLQGNRVETRWVAGGTRALVQQKQALRRAIRDGRADDASKRAENLYSLLIEPFGAVPAHISTLVIVADEPLKDIPYSFLRDRRRGKYLVEDFELLHAPSASVYVRAQSVAPSARSVLAIGDPSFNRSLFPAMPVLPDAARETRKIAKLYSHSLVLTGERATFAALAENSRSADVINLATHAIAAPASQLLLAPDADNGLADVQRVASLRVKKGSTILIGGCQTAINHLGYGDLQDFAGVFLAAGAGHAVATLWDVEDAEAGYFSVQFHRALAAHRRPAAAARAAQLAMLRSPDFRFRDPIAWSSFQIYTLSDQEHRARPVAQQ